MALDTAFLRDLCLAPGPSGFEAPVQRVVLEHLPPSATPHLDALGNLAADLNPDAAPHVLMVAHGDQIGLIVTYVDERGFVHFDTMGNIDPLLLPGRELVIHTRRGEVHGVVGKVPPHFIAPEQRGKAPKVAEQFLDIGASTKASALDRIAVGDPITFAPRFIELSDGVFSSLALDNRAGLYAAFRAMQLYADMKGKARLTAASSVQEETTFMGAKALTHRYKPDCTIVIDGEFTSDYPGVDAQLIGGDHRLGDGPVIARGSAGNEALFELAMKTAEEEQIPVQVRAFAGNWSTDGDELAAAGATATLSVGIPMRYVHTPFEVVRGEDLERAARLLAKLTVRLGELYKPGYLLPPA